jgi:hypothetical protein
MAFIQTLHLVYMVYEKENKRALDAVQKHIKPSFWKGM